MSLEAAARRVLAHYPPDLAAGAWTFLGANGGFSGACLWRRSNPPPALCLRAWPEKGPTPQQLSWIHTLLERAHQAGLEYVPRLQRTRQGATWVLEAGRLWEITTWLPGQADFRQRPSPRRLQAACRALARLHRLWAGHAPTIAPCPDIARRLARAQHWQQLLSRGWQPLIPGDPDPVHQLSRRLWQLLPPHLPAIVAALRPWTQQPVPLQPCLGDIWHAHVLFQGEEVSGLVDYGGVHRGHVAGDLARLVGSLLPLTPPAWRCQVWELALKAYEELCPLTAGDRQLLHVLDQSGVVLSAANWLCWLYDEKRSFPERTAVTDRLRDLVQRLENDLLLPTETSSPLLFAGPRPFPT
jgi:Ser/Thr protein kinase RdoA (MazF antagonist)